MEWVCSDEQLPEDSLLMCLNCGCGELSNNHGYAMNITRSRLAVIAHENLTSMEDQAINILATLRGEITTKKPRGDDKIVVTLKRIKGKPETKAEYVPRTRTTKES